MIALLQSIHKPGRRLWDQWKDLETGETISSATLIVTAANDFTRQINDRMPVLLDRQDQDALIIREGRCRTVAARTERSLAYVAGLEMGQCVWPG